jgi:hypothetical protein
LRIPDGRLKIMATTKKVHASRRVDVEAVLPWYAAGTLNVREIRLVDDALASDPELGQMLVEIREESAEAIRANESLGAPSPRVVRNLFAAIDAEPPRPPSASVPASAWPTRFLANLSPKALAWSTALGALLLLLQAGAIGALLMTHQSGVWPATIHSLSEAGPVAFVRFAPDTTAAQITDFLDRYGASVVETTTGGTFRLQFRRLMTQQDLAVLMNKLQNERIISLAGVAP